VVNRIGAPIGSLQGPHGKDPRGRPV
jgi:hypothetical protein